MDDMACLHIILGFLLITLFILTVHSQNFEPLGSHSSPSVGAPLLYGKFPQPFVFYHHFVKAGKPLLMKNVLNETGYEIFQTWTDDYLRERYGEETIEIEKKKKEQRGHRRSKLKFSKFIDVYQKLDMYMINSASRFMQDEVMVPFTLQCGGFQNVLHDAFVWFSNGDTKSVLHYDMMDNINCLLDGKKTLVLIDKKHKKSVEANGFVQEGRYSLVDVDMVDGGAFPGVATAPWARIDMIKGDCVYIPYKWYHHIRSAPGRNLAVNLWFSHLLWFNKANCDNVNRNNTPLTPLGDFNLASTNENLRSEIFSPFENLDDVKKKDFFQKSVCKIEDNEQIWNMVNRNKDGKITWEEIYSVDIDKLVLTVPECVQDILELPEKVNTADVSSNGSDNSYEQESNKNFDSDVSVKSNGVQMNSKLEGERTVLDDHMQSNDIKDKDALKSRNRKSDLDEKSESLSSTNSSNTPNKTGGTIHDEF